MFWKLINFFKGLFFFTGSYSNNVFPPPLNEKEEQKHKEGIDYSNVGRNDKCPCGSGKKYKNCCMPR